MWIRLRTCPSLATLVLSLVMSVRVMGAEQAQKPAGHEAPPLSVAPLQTAWLGSDAGKTDAVLPPWTPVVVNPSGDGFRIDVWGRSYLFDGAGAFPSQIVTKGENVLAQPIRLSGKMDGKVIEWKKAPIQLEQNKPAAAILTQNLVSSDEKVALSVRTQVEYDGMIRTDWKLEPRALARLEELTVEIPMKSECTKLMYCFPDYARRRFYGCGAVPEAGFKTAFTPFVWLGDNEKGLQWFCESDENWNIADPSQAIEIEQEGEKTVLRLRLVSVPTPMSPGAQGVVGGRSYTFGLIASPVRPVVKSTWDYRIMSSWADPYHLRLDYFAGLGMKTIVAYNWTDVIFGYYYPVGHSEDMHNLVKSCHERGMGVIPYWGTWTSEAAPEWKRLGDKVKVVPQDTIHYAYPNMKEQQTCSKACCHSEWQDLWVAEIARMMGDYDIDGVYLDGIVTPWPCKNRQHGCGYVKADGSVQPTWPIFATRETMRRIYAVVKSRKPDGEIIIHTSSAIPLPCLSWGTSAWSGEQFGAGVYDLPEDDGALPIYSTMNTGLQWGVPAQFLYETRGWKFGKGCAFSLLYDALVLTNVEDMKLQSQIWHVMDEFGRKEAEWLPFWRNAEYVKVSPKGAYASLYKHPRNGVLAVVSNLSRANAKVQVQFDIEKLGLQRRVVARDALASKPLAIQDGQIQLDLAPLGWSIVWLRPDYTY